MLFRASFVDNSRHPERRSVSSFGQRRSARECFVPLVRIVHNTSHARSVLLRGSHASVHHCRAGGISFPEEDLHAPSRTKARCHLFAFFRHYAGNARESGSRRVETTQRAPHTKGDRIDCLSIHKRRCTTYSSWEESPLWERELDNETHKRIQMRS